MKKSVLFSLLICLSMSVSTIALGQKKKAADLFDQGVSALEKQDYQEALTAFKEAYNLSPHWAVLAHIGACHAKMDQPVEAIKALEQYLAEGGAKIPSDERETAKTLIKEQKAKVGTLVLSVRKGVEVEVDGKSIGASPFDEIYLTAGKHTVVVIFAEDDVVKRNINIEGGQEFVLRIKEEPHVVEAPPPPPEGAEDEAPEEAEPKAALEIEDATEPEDDQPIEEKEEEMPRGEGSLVPFYATLGVAAAGLVAGGLGWGLFAHYRISSNNYSDEIQEFQLSDPEFMTYTYESTCESREVESKSELWYCDTEWNRKDFQKKSDAWFIVGVAGSGVAVASGVLAVIFYINRHWFAKGSDSASVTMLPVIGPRQNGLAVSLTF